MRKTWTAVAWLAVGFLPGTGAAQEPIEVPLRIDGGRMIVEVTDEQGRAFDFVLGVSNGFVTRTGAQRLEGATLTLGGVPFSMEGHQTVPDDYLAHEGSAQPLGIIGGEAFVNYDILIDAPHGRMLVKPAGRSVGGRASP